jgi:hypothetical protein
MASYWKHARVHLLPLPKHTSYVTKNPIFIGLRREYELRGCVTAQPLGSILEAKPLHQGQKTRILGRGSQSCSHLYSTLPVPSQDEGLTGRTAQLTYLFPRTLAPKHHCLPSPLIPHAYTFDIQFNTLKYRGKLLTEVEYRPRDKRALKHRIKDFLCVSAWSWYKIKGLW